MTIKEIYQAFDQIGCLSFTTVDEENRPESCIAHLRGYDHNGIYFMTMHTKSFYQQLKRIPIFQFVVSVLILKFPMTKMVCLLLMGVTPFE